MDKTAAWLRFLTRLPACLALLVLAACAPAPAPADPLALVVAAPRGALASAIEAAAAEYTLAGGGPVRVEAFGAQDYGGQLNAALLAGLDRYDLIYLSSEDLARWAAYNAIQPIAGPLDDPALAPFLPAVMVSGQVYGVPTQPDPVVLWYRADLLRAAGLPVPAGPEDLLRAARAAGMVTAGNDVDAGMAFAALLAGFGGQMVSADYQVQVNEETAVRALEAYAALSPPGAERLTGADVVAALREGRAALGIAPFSAADTLLDCAASPKVCQSGQARLAWARLPGLEEGQAFGSLGAWAVPLRAARAAGAQRFAAWLGSPEGAAAWARGGGTPASAAGPPNPPQEHPLARVTRYRLAFPPVATTGQLWKAANTAVSEAVSGKKPPRQALDEAAGQMRAALRQAGYQSEE